jgi:hypothetical protein
MAEIPGQFWTGNSVVDPALQFRFRILHKGEFLWWAKSCDKPKVNIPVLGKDEYYLGSNLPDTRPGEIMDFQPITMVMVDPRADSGMSSSELMTKFQVLDSDNPMGCWPRIDGSSIMQEWSSLAIETIDHLGDVVELWELNDCFPTSIDFGSLQYSGEALVETTIVWEYSSFSMSYKKGGEMVNQISAQNTRPSPPDSIESAKSLDGSFT